MTAELTVLHAGYAELPSVASTVVYIADGDRRVLIDPGMVAGPQLILNPLTELGVDPASVTDVVISHHHPDHTWHLALFPAARVHDFWAVYRGDNWEMRPAEGREVGPSVRLVETPGHTPQDITTLVDTADGLVACTHLWWNADGPPEDPLGDNAEALHAGRERVLSLGPVRIVPGHGPAFAPTDSTPR